MAQQIKARGQITIIDQNDSVQAQMFIGANQPLSQIYVKDNNSFIPNWSTSPFLILKASLFISGITGDAIANAGIIKAGSTVWRKINAAGTSTVISNGGNYVISGSTPWQLTVKENLMLGSTVDAANTAEAFQFSAIMIDPSSGLETNIQATIQFTAIAGTNDSLNILMSCPDGVVFKNEEVQSLRIKADMWRGSTMDSTDFSYVWGLQEPGVFAPTTTAASAATGQNNVTFTSIDNVVAGQLCKIGSATYTIASVNTGTKVVTMTTNITTAIASGVAITNPYYNAKLGVNWAAISADAFFDGVTGYTTNEITVPADAVLDLETYKVAVTDIDTQSATYNMTISGFASLTDVTDPIQIDIAAPQGNIIKNGVNNITLRADVWRSGIKIDEDGTSYEYVWTMFDKDGNVNTTFTDSTDPSVNRGKTLDISQQTISGKATFELKLMTLS